MANSFTPFVSIEIFILAGCPMCFLPRVFLPRVLRQLIVRSYFQCIGMYWNSVLSHKVCFYCVYCLSLDSSDLPDTTGDTIILEKV